MLPLLVRTRFQVLFHSLAGFFSPFPHGTGSLSVSQEYLALEDGPHIQTGYHVSRPTLRVHNLCILVYGTITLYRRTFQTVPLTHKLIKTLGCSPFARRYWGISVDFFSSGYLDVSVPRFASLTYVFS